MKYFLLIAFTACGYGQYPSLNYMDYYNNRYGQTNKDSTPFRIIKDSGSYWFTKPNNDTLFVISKTYIRDTTPVKIYVDFDTTIPDLSDIHEIQWGSYNNETYVEMRIVDADTTIIVSGDSLSAIKLLFKAWHDATQFDSSKFYHEKQNYWQKKMDKESRRLDRLKTPQISQKLLDYQDSLIHYQLLLLKKIKNGSK